jgi:hypothetical protein
VTNFSNKTEKTLFFNLDFATKVKNRKIFELLLIEMQIKKRPRIELISKVKAKNVIKDRK